MNICPKCGKELEEYQDVCDSCIYNFNEELTCPYKINKERNLCLFKKLCPYNGLAFEDCETYLEQALNIK